MQPQQPTNLSNPPVLTDQEIASIAAVNKTVRAHYKSPAFWFHVALQLLVWYGYFHTASQTVKLGDIGFSFASLSSYLIHLTKIING